MPKDTILAVRISAEDRELLKRAAAKDDRTESAIMRRGAIREARAILRER